MSDADEPTPDLIAALNRAVARLDEIQRMFRDHQANVDQLDAIAARLEAIVERR